MTIKVYNCTLQEAISKAGNPYKYILLDFGVFKKRLYLEQSLIEVLENLSKSAEK